MNVSDNHDACKVRGLFADMEAARRAIDALQNDGAEASSISLSGEGADAAERMANSSATATLATRRSSGA